MDEAGCFAEPVIHSLECLAKMVQMSGNQNYRAEGRGARGEGGQREWSNIRSEWKTSNIRIAFCSALSPQYLAHSGHSMNACKGPK